jgi:hypothetical protein
VSEGAQASKGVVPAMFKKLSLLPELLFLALVVALLLQSALPDV